MALLYLEGSIPILGTPKAIFYLEALLYLRLIREEILLPILRSLRGILIPLWNNIRLLRLLPFLGTLGGILIPLWKNLRLQLLVLLPLKQTGDCIRWGMQEELRQLHLGLLKRLLRYRLRVR
jgi:hypothetical protein